MDEKEKTCKEFIDLYFVVKRVREECPWDQKQTPQTLIPYFLEEAYELIDALEKNDQEMIKEELGDILLHVLMQSIMAEEKNRFNFEEVCKNLKVKLITRHPHVFGEVKIKGVEDVLTNWESIKSKEKDEEGILSGIPQNMPALLTAFRIQEKASHVGFDWKKSKEIIPKLYEELKELEKAIQEDNKEDMEEEIGDLLFTIVNIARHLGIDPESSLRKTNKKFTERFKYIEDRIKESGKEWKDFSLEELDKLWESSKTL